MKYFEYRRYKFKLKLYKVIAIAAGGGLLYLYLKLLQMGYTSEQMIKLIYVFCFLVIVVLLGIKLGSRAIRRHKYLNSPLAAVDQVRSLKNT